MLLRWLGNSSLQVTPVALGCWPITGLTSIDVNDADSLATIAAAVDAGINFLDTAYIYGPAGESERMIARAVGHRRNELVIATKGGIHWDAQLVRQHDARPETIVRECETSLRRLGTDRVEVYYLHAPDPKIPIADSAGAIARLIEQGKVLAAGASNCTVAQLQEFHALCPLAVVQPPYNMLQRDIEADIVPWCRDHHVAIACYWPLMKGLLAGKLARHHRFAANDGRAKYPMFQGDEWQKNQDFLDELRAIAAEVGCTVAQLVINWTIHQPGITAALCGAKRPQQIRETTQAMEFELSQVHMRRIDMVLARRGKPLTRWAV
jgi:aryl-alcohol dehydrogenase-like predicted oxidoreductase